MYSVVPIAEDTPCESFTLLTVAVVHRDVEAGEEVARATPGEPDSSRVVRGVVSFYTSNALPDFYELYPDPFPGDLPSPVT